jgi:hypothetical protein
MVLPAEGIGRKKKNSAVKLNKSFEKGNHQSS